MIERTALIAGATGLVGHELVRQILAGSTFQSITILTRKELPYSDERIKTIFVPDFDKLDEHEAAFNVTDVFCCLGTTRKQAGSKAQFKKIDLTYPINMAKMAMKHADFKTYHVVTAKGANSDSALFYNQIKGELEDELKQMGLPALNIYRPSLLLGKRDHTRVMEDVAKAISSFLSFFVIGVRIGRLWSIKAEDVAKSILVVARLDQPGCHIYEPKQMMKLANS